VSSKQNRASAPGRLRSAPARRFAEPAAEPEPELFPMFLKIAGRSCLVVGAGHIAEPKIESLLRCGARVRVVAPAATPAIREAASAGKVVWEQRAFRPADLNGAFLVVAATSSPELHQQIFELARESAILCNAVDEPSRCDFYYGAVVRRGPLQIAISTAGNSPSLAQRLRHELEQQFEPAYAEWVMQIGKARDALMSDVRIEEQRKSALKEISSERAFRSFQRRTKSESSATARASRPRHAGSKRVRVQRLRAKRPEADHV
jgi:precorrin-2 dehydrogenase/sirohydrochlorin ferrochelatase